MDIEHEFKVAAQKVRNSKPVSETSNEQKLRFYSLYKQATEGSNFSPEPWAFQLKEHAQWTAWKKLRGMTRDASMKLYVAETDLVFK